MMTLVFGRRTPENPRRSRRARALLAVTVVAAAGLVGCGSPRDSDDGGNADPAPTSSSTTTAPSTTTTTAPTTTAPSTTTTAPTTATTEAGGPIEPVSPDRVPLALPGTTTPVWSDGSYARGDEGPDILSIEQRLAALGFRPGDVDGVFSAQTASAVMAFQKFEDIERDGKAGPETLAHLVAPTGAGPRGPAVPHIEVDLDRQILFALDGTSMFIINISSGNGRYYNENGSSGTAYTPTGDYTIERRINGNHKAPLGVLYRPLFFLRGWAIHGSSSVPGYPASHGCVRTSNADQDYLWDAFANGAPVSVYSGDPEAPSEQTTPATAEPGA